MLEVVAVPRHKMTSSMLERRDWSASNTTLPDISAQKDVIIRVHDAGRVDC